ncbi:MAG: tRNA adenosine(34) deaminase TadA [Clostridia bacterium]|nr:tRNA adenosine(34) deaminase TadA [Clostridia bacterium]
MLLSEHEKYMKLALAQAKAAYRNGEVPVGAIIVRNGEVIATAHNLMEKKHDATAHAEILAIRKASKFINDWRLSDCTLYSTLEPCVMCIGACVNSKLKGLVFGAYDERLGCAGSRIDLGDSWFNHSIVTIGGVMEKECALLLKRFFLDKRSNDARFYN